MQHEILENSLIPDFLISTEWQHFCELIKNPEHPSHNRREVEPVDAHETKRSITKAGRERAKGRGESLSLFRAMLQ